MYENKSHISASIPNQVNNDCDQTIIILQILIFIFLGVFEFDVIMQLNWFFFFFSFICGAWHYCIAKRYVLAVRLRERSWCRVTRK